jgi:hypothetical protein
LTCAQDSGWLFVDALPDGCRTRGSGSAREGSSTRYVGYRIDLDSLPADLRDALAQLA